MLRELYIENLAVIKSACIGFCSGFNVFTGETGAGKSILIGGINAVLGQRVTKDIVRSGCEKATVTALFTEPDEAVRSILSENGYECPDGELVVTREIRADGGSTARINSRTAPVSLLREIGTLLVNIHGQHDSQILLAPERHLSVLEGFGADYTLLNEYQKLFADLRETAKKLNALKQSEKSKTERLAFLEERIAELSELGLERGEDVKISEEYAIAKSAKSVASAAEAAREALDGDGESAVGLIFAAENELEGIFDAVSEAPGLCERLAAARLELRDIGQTLSSWASEYGIDEERCEYVIARYEQLSRLKRRYGLEIDEIVDMLDGYVDEKNSLDVSDDEIAVLSARRAELLAAATQKARELSDFRKKTADEFCSRTAAELEFLNMPGVRLEAGFESGKLTHTGMDTLEFLIASNPGEPPKPIAKIASGGELSRIMLALKSVIAHKDSVPTLIFDEIDSGVSGRAAQKIGIKLRGISSHHQVLCVTHLSQIAVMANNHILIEKKTCDGKTETEVSTLNFDGRVAEIARIMGGDNPSPLMLENAAEELRKNDISRQEVV